MPQGTEQPQVPAVKALPQAAPTHPAEAERQELSAWIAQHAPTVLAGVKSDDPTEAAATSADARATLAGERTYSALAGIGREG